MEENQHPREDFNRKDVPKNGHSAFDELARGLASGALTRGQALKLVGAALLGFSSLGLLEGVAGAKAMRHKGRAAAKAKLLHSDPAGSVSAQLVKPKNCTKDSQCTL